MKWRPQSRRAFLASAGTILPLPFLESLVPKWAKTAQAATAQRAVFVFSPNGFVWNSIFPDAPGANYKMPETLAPLEKYRAKIALPMHVDNSVGKFPGDHANGTACFLTCARPPANPASVKEPSFDWQLATQMAGGNKKVTVIGWGGSAGDGGAGDFGVSLKYINTVSWSSPNEQVIPLKLDDHFKVLFANASNPMASAGDNMKRAIYGKKVLDFNLAEANSLKGKLGSEDQKKLDRYMTGVSELEGKITSMGGGGSAECGKRYPGPVRVPNTNYYGEWQKAGYSMVAMALECDISRVVTYMLGSGFSNQSYGFLGIGGAEYSPDTQHHIVSHHGNDPGKLNKLKAIDKHTFANFATFIGQMDSIDDGGGKTLLDNSVVYISSDVAEGDHAHSNYPVVMAGSAGGKLKTGQYWKLNTKKQSDIFTTIYRAFGINKNFADSSGPIAEMLL